MDDSGGSDGMVMALVTGDLQAVVLDSDEVVAMDSAGGSSSCFPFGY